MKWMMPSRSLCCSSFSFLLLATTGCCYGPVEQPRGFDPGLTECEQACGPAAGDFRRACLESGESEEACASRAEAFYFDCLEGCAQGTDAADAPCEDLEDDMPDTGAGAEADPEPADTQGGQDEDQAAPSGDCPVACPDYAYLVYHQCLDQGGSPDECEQAFNDAYAWCRSACHPEGELDDTDELDAACRATCEAEADGFLETCQAESADPASCQEPFEVMLTACLTGCEDQVNAACEQACHDAGEALLDQCLAEGGAEDECRAWAEDEVGACVNDCHLDEPAAGGEETSPGCDAEAACTTWCEEYAYQVYLGCVEDVSDNDCEFMLEVAFEGCVAGCSFAADPDGVCAQDETGSSL